MTSVQASCQNSVNPSSSFFTSLGDQLIVLIKKMDLAAFAPVALAWLWRAVQFYFLSNLRKKINIVINKHNILIDCLHKLAFALFSGGIGCRRV
jgi:hypothetical protein